MARINTNLYVRDQKNNANVREYFPDFDEVLCGMETGNLTTSPEIAVMKRMGQEAYVLFSIILAIPGVRSVAFTRTTFTVTISPVYDWESIQTQIKEIFAMTFNANVTLLDFDQSVPKERRV